MAVKQWNREQFDALKATWPSERIAEDEAMLAKVFALADACPKLAEALAWAKEHDIEFFIDRESQGNLLGYYSYGTGIVGLVASKLYDDRGLVDTLVHEIRHAWQDYNGFIAWDDDAPQDGDFNSCFIRTVLTEADALAFGRMAGAEISLATQQQYEPFDEEDKNWQAKLIAGKEELLADEVAGLGKGFMAWFETGWFPAAYGGDISKIYGAKWGLYDGEAPRRDLEFRNKPPMANPHGVDIGNINEVLRMGVTFAGTKNYLAALPRDMLAKEILRPSLADTFWGAAREDQKKLTVDIRKAVLRKKLSAPKARHPWP